jgi:hypothetical protein
VSKSISSSQRLACLLAQAGDIPLRHILRSELKVLRGRIGKIAAMSVKANMHIRMINQQIAYDFILPFGLQTLNFQFHAITYIAC